MRSSTKTLIATMAFADLLMTIDIPYILKWVYVSSSWFGTFMGTVLCKFFHASQVGFFAASVFSLVAISLDRSFAILFPMNNDSKRCSFRDRHDVARCAGVNASTYDSHQEYTTEGRGGYDLPRV